ncbi:MAG: hypothetical protein CMN63_00100 [Sphingobium sp.]|jgi:hypothetical protein|nr:hypothetical protein [Sphingobium sp.]
MTRNRFAPARESLAWAEMALDEFRALCVANVEGLEWHLFTEFDEERCQTVQLARLNKSFDRNVARKGTDALERIKRSCDQIAHAAVELTHPTSEAKVFFPWGKSRASSERSLRRLKLDDAIALEFSNFEPYPPSPDYDGGDPLIPILSEIANRGHTIGIGFHASLCHAEIGPAETRGGRMRIPDLKWDSEKEQVELCRWSGDVDPPSDYVLEVAFTITDKLLRRPVEAEPALRTFKAKADRLLDNVEAGFAA